ncbi:hypothetical protein [Peptostreptococcus faecalis]|uniref:hypothetical protein n=1 Tax=Peptostreptococcus faecalis TaxID=2045015 RepID=UPI001FA8D170|nr:hypothetical protein [Peptostreptococcus faecalis]
MDLFQCLDINLSSLRFKGETRYPKDKRGQFNIGKPIAKRPKIVKERSEFSHWD